MIGSQFSQVKDSCNKLSHIIVGWLKTLKSFLHLTITIIISTILNFDVFVMFYLQIPVYSNYMEGKAY